MPKPTMKSIACKLGISVSAVSIALNGRPGVSDEMRERIVAAALADGYDLARLSPVSKPTAKICIIYRDFAGIGDRYFQSESGDALLRGLVSRLAEAGHVPSHRQMISTEITPELLDFEEDAALIIDACMSEQAAAIYEQSHKPIVVLSSYVTDRRINTITYDNREAVMAAVRTLMVLGHREIGYLQLTADTHNYAQRQQGWRDALQALDLPAGPVFVFGNIVNAEMDEIWQAIHQWLVQTKPTATAYIAANDYVAMAAIRALRSAGKIPGQDVALIGFDDRPFARLCDPALASIRIDEEGLGRAAAERLISLLNLPGQSPQRIHLTLPLIIRESLCPFK